MPTPRRWILWLSCAEWSQVARIYSELVVNSRWAWGVSLWSSEGLELLLSEQRFDLHASQCSPVATVYKALRHHHACLQAQRCVGWHEQGGGVLQRSHIPSHCWHLMSCCLKRHNTLHHHSLQLQLDLTACVGSHNVGEISFSKERGECVISYC